MRTRYREVMLPLLLLPLLVPVLLGAVRATTALVEEGTLPWTVVEGGVRLSCPEAAPCEDAVTFKIILG